MNDRPMTFLEHLEEFRRAVIYACLSVLSISLICLFFSPQIFLWLRQPLQEFMPEGSQFIAIGPFESYAVYLKIALTFGVLFSTPLIFFFLWRFIRPGLEKKETKGIVPLSIICGGLFIGGALFGYFIVFPAGFRFAMKFLRNTNTSFFPIISNYLSLSLRMLMAFGLIFELPLFLLILGKLRVVNAQQLRRFRKYAIVLIFLIAGILTPGPDVFSQVMMAMPLLILFEVGVVLVAWVRPKNKSTKAMELPPT